MNALFGVYVDVTERPCWQTLRTMAYLSDAAEYSGRVSHEYGRIKEQEAKARRGK